MRELFDEGAKNMGFTHALQEKQRQEERYFKESLHWNPERPTKLPWFPEGCLSTWEHRIEVGSRDRYNFRLHANFGVNY
jgi:hypothetical protein